MSFVCQRCNQAKATVHITDTVPEKREQHLCEECAEKEGVIIKQPHSSNEILQQFIKQKPGKGVSEDLTCTRCGATFREFQLNGQLGCPHDYEAFRKLLMPLIERAHQGATRHVGKVPASAGPSTVKRVDLVRLRRELQDALQQEDYELAARVRAQIQDLESP